MNTLLFLIIGIPILEIYLFIKIGSQIGAFNTISLIFITAIVGVFYARYEGFNTLKSGMARLIKNEIPIEITSNINSFSEIDNRRYYGVENYGILINDIENNNSWNSYIPNTIYKNQYDAIALTKDKHLVGVVNHKDDNGQSGGFIYKNPLKTGPK